MLTEAKRSMILLVVHLLLFVGIRSLGKALEADRGGALKKRSRTCIDTDGFGAGI